MQFVYVIGHCRKKNICGNFLVPAQRHVAFKLFRLAGFIILRLDIAFGLDILKIGIVFFAFISLYSIPLFRSFFKNGIIVS